MIILPVFLVMKVSGIFTVYYLDCHTTSKWWVFVGVNHWEMGLSTAVGWSSKYGNEDSLLVANWIEMVGSGKTIIFSGWEWSWECHDLSNTGSQQSYTHIVLERATASTPGPGKTDLPIIWSTNTSFPPTTYCSMSRCVGMRIFASNY